MKRKKPPSTPKTGVRMRTVASESKLDETMMLALMGVGVAALDPQKRKEVAKKMHQLADAIDKMDS